MASRSLGFNVGVWAAIAAAAGCVSACADNFCIGCTTPGESVPMQPAQSIMRYRFYDSVTQVEYASGCAVSRSAFYPNVDVAVPLNVEYTADIYAERIGTDSDAGVDTRSTEAICADDFVFYTNGFELKPGCLDGLSATSLLELYPIDMSGAPIANATSTSIGGARYVAISSDYGSASFYAITAACGDGYTFSFWNVVPPN